MNTEEICEEQREVLDKLLVLRVAGIIGRLEVKGKGYNLGNRSQNFREHLNKLLVIRIILACLQTTNLCQALQSNISELWHLQKARTQRVDDRRLEDIAKGNPVEKAKESLKGCLDKACLSGTVQDFIAKLEDRRELGAHSCLQVLGLR
jgi:hypothetical protein